jgi:hypothetical protein
MSKDLAFNENANIAWDLHEKNEIVPLEFTEEIKPEMYGLEVTEATQLLGGIDIISAELEVLKNAYIDVISLEITTENLPVFKDLRKNFTKNRTSRERLRKAKKAYFLNGGRFVDAVFKNIDAECELMESKLLAVEKFFENQEKEKARKLNESRIERLKPYIQDVTGLDFSEFDDESFDDYVLGKKTRFENEAKEKAEAEALALREIEIQKLKDSNKEALLPYKLFIDNFDLIDFENVDLISVLDLAKTKKAEADKKAKEQEIENAKLKADAEAKAKELEKERAEAKAKQDAVELKAKQDRERDAKIQAEKDAEIKRLAAEIKAKQDAEIKAENERLAKIELAKKAPEKEQLLQWGNSLKLEVCPIENKTSAEIIEKFESFKKWAINKINE